MGFILGMILAILIGYFVFAQGRKVDIKSFFRWTTLLLVFLASGMIAYGSHEIESYLAESGNLGILGIESKSDISRPWDILTPTKELSKENKQWMYTYNIKGKKHRSPIETPELIPLVQSQGKKLH